MNQPHAFLVALLGAMLLPASGLAQRHHHEEHEHKNELALFVGGTYDNDEGTNSFTIGGDYEFRFHPRVGISAEAEYVVGPDTGVFAFPVIFHVYRGLMVLAGPGVEHTPRVRPEVPGELLDELGEAHVEPEEAGSRFLVRVGAQYAIHVGARVSIIPAVDFDFVNGHERVEALFVYGVKIGFGF